MSRLVLRCFVVMTAWTGAGVADAAPQPLAALSAIQPGQWSIRAKDGGARSRSICLGDPRQLLQPRHSGAVCSRFVIANDANQTIVHYTCPGAGHGRTIVRVETGRLIQIDSQGIADNAPFAFQLEGRRTGECGTGGSGSGR